MSEEKSSSANSRDILANFADLYAEKPLIRALFTFVIGLIPGASAFSDTVQELIASGVEDIQRERQREFFDELSVDEGYLNKEIIGKNDFIHAFICTYRVAMRTRRKEKIRMFARLLLTGVRENQLDGEELEEFVSILNDLSIRELRILLILKRFENENPYQKAENGEIENELQRTSRYWDTFLAEAASTVGVTEEIITAMLSRLNRTGLYQTINGSYYGYAGNHGFLTQLFDQFSYWLEATPE